jgi:hypothetical protein
LEDDFAPSKMQLQEPEQGSDAAVKSSQNEKTKVPWYTDFLQKLLLLVIGFVLTYWCGNYLTDKFRRETAKTEFEFASMQSDISRSLQIFEDVSRMMDKRLFRMRRLHDTFVASLDSDTARERLIDYRNTLIEWNDNINRYRSLFSLYFAPNNNSVSSDSSYGFCGNNFETVAAEFANAHIELQRLIDKKEGGSAKKLEAMLEGLNICVYDLDEFMLKRIDAMRATYREKIGSH